MHGRAPPPPPPPPSAGHRRRPPPPALVENDDPKAAMAQRGGSITAGLRSEEQRGTMCYFSTCRRAELGWLRVNLAQTRRLTWGYFGVGSAQVRRERPLLLLGAGRSCMYGRSWVYI